MTKIVLIIIWIQSANNKDEFTSFCYLIHCLFEAQIYRLFYQCLRRDSFQISVAELNGCRIPLDVDIFYMHRTWYRRKVLHTGISCYFRLLRELGHWIDCAGLFRYEIQTCPELLASTLGSAAPIEHSFDRDSTMQKCSRSFRLS